MMEDDIISESRSPWASPVVLVGKKDGSTRFCVDYRKLNQITIRDSYPLSRIRMAPEDKNKTAFITNDDLYEFNVMPFGFSTSSNLSALYGHGFSWFEMAMLAGILR